MKLIQSIARYCKAYKNRVKEIKREQDNILYYFISVSLYCMICTIYRPQIGK